MIGSARACLCLVAATAIDAACDPQSHVLQWTRAPGAESCIDEPSLVAGVEQRLGRALAGDALRLVEGTVEPTADGFRARFTIRDESGAVVGERELVEVGVDCRKLDDKLTLVIALLVEDRAAQPVEPAPVPAIDRDNPLPVPARPSRRSWSFGIGASGTAAVGLLPSLGVGGRVSFAVEPPSLPRIEIAVGGWAPDRETVPSGGIRFTLAGASFAACPRLLSRRRIAARACFGAEVDRMVAAGFDFDMNERRIDWNAHVTAELGVAIPITGRISGTVGIAGWSPLVRPRYVYFDGAQTRVLYQAPVAAAVVGLGVMVGL